MKNFKITPPALVLTRSHTRALAKAMQRERGATTAEYALITLAAAALAAVMMVVLKSDGVKDAISGVIQAAFSM